jgi:hypothetical protein
MYRRAVLSGLLAIPFVKFSYAAGWTLISQEEFERDSVAPQARSLQLAPATPGVPSIEIQQPDETRPIQTPVTIRLLFRAQPSAVIDPNSFRATYGWLRIDITRRIIDHAQVNASGLFANNAEVPAGHHKITLEIADNFHRVGMRTFEFTVLG